MCSIFAERGVHDCEWQLDNPLHRRCNTRCHAMKQKFAHRAFQGSWRYPLSEDSNRAVQLGFLAIVVIDGKNKVAADPRASSFADCSNMAAAPPQTHGAPRVSLPVGNKHGKQRSGTGKGICGEIGTKLAKYEGLADLIGQYCV